MKLDDYYDRLQWSKEEYILEELETECNLIKDNNHYPREVMYFIGYVYRFWHYYKGVNSKEIYTCAAAEKMKECYLGFHTMDPKMAIDNLIEISKL